MRVRTRSLGGGGGHGGQPKERLQLCPCQAMAKHGRSMAYQGFWLATLCGVIAGAAPLLKYMTIYVTVRQLVFVSRKNYKVPRMQYDLLVVLIVKYRLDVDLEVLGMVRCLVAGYWDDEVYIYSSRSVVPWVPGSAASLYGR